MEEINIRIHELTDQICLLYYDRVNVETMQVQNVSAAFIKGIYEQLSIESNNVMELYRDKAQKSLYYSINKVNHRFFVWTSRYLIGYDNKSINSAFHKFTVFDSFNDKSL
jgi:hypothetical protein